MATPDWHPETLAIHADTEEASSDIAPPLHLSTTFQFAPDWNDRYAASKGWIQQAETYPAIQAGQEHVYSRDSTDTRDRLEAVLGALEGGHAITYSSGLAAIHGAFAFVQPKRVIMSREGYHGSHGVLEVFKRGRDLKVLYVEDGTHEFFPGDLIWLESPQNPRGEIADIVSYASRRPPGATLAIDATFAPSPLQKTLAYGADIVMHSTTKFLGGHSDLLGGVLVVNNLKVAEELRCDRTSIGSVMGSMEAWLLLRSLRSLSVRLRQHSNAATALASWLDAKDEPATQIVERVWHGSLPHSPGHDAGKRQGEGWSGVLSIEFKSHHHARLLCNRGYLRIIANATSLGGCESLIEWRAVVDSTITPTLVRLSVGLENVKDLQDDLRQALLRVANDAAGFE